METRLNLQPGQNGTKTLVQKYGERLVCVRYRYDAETQMRHKTVELIEESIPWQPQGSRESHLMQRARNERVLVQVAFEEKTLRETLRRRGGRWQPEEKAWTVDYGVVVELGLADRIVGDI